MLRKSCTVSLATLGIVGVSLGLALIRYALTNGAAPDPHRRWADGGYYASRTLAFDGRTGRFAASSPATGRGDIWEFPPGGGAGRPLFESPETELYPAFADDGTLYFSRLVAGKFEIFALPSGARAPRLVVSRTGHCVHPRPLPNGEEVAYIRQRMRWGLRGSEVWVRSLKTGTERLVDASEESYGSPSCFPDSRRLLIERSSSDRENDIIVLDLSNGAEEIVGRGFLPSVSRDGTYYHVVRPRGDTYEHDLWRCDFKGGCRLVHNGGGYVFAVTALPNDRVGQIAIVDEASGRRRLVSRIVK